MENFTLEDGVLRMTPEWRKKLWVDFDRDRAIETPRVIFEEETDLFVKEMEELCIDNHSASVDYLKQFTLTITNTSTLKNLRTLVISKVLFTQEKAELVSKALASDNCAITELSFNRCRAKTDKMGMLFGGLAHNTSVTSLTLQDMNIPRDSLVAMVDMFGTNRSILMLTLLNCGLSDNSIQIMSQGLQ